MIDPAVPRKLGLRPGKTARVLNGPAGFASALRDAAPDVPVTEGGDGRVDCVLVFCADRSELDRFGPAAIAAYTTGGYFWVAYRKGGARAGTDLGRDVDWGPLPAAGFTQVSLVSLDATWSALRFRRLDEVGR